MGYVASTLRRMANGRRGPLGHPNRSMHPATSQQMQQYALCLIALVMRRDDRARADGPRFVKQNSIPLAASRFFDADARVHLSWRRGDRYDPRFISQRAGKFYRPSRVITGCRTELVIDVHEQRLNIQRRLHAPQCRCQRQGVPTSRKADDEAITTHETGVTGTSQ